MNNCAIFFSFQKKKKKKIRKRAYVLIFDHPSQFYTFAVIFNSAAECFRRQRTVKLSRRRRRRRRRQLVRAKLPVVVCAREVIACTIFGCSVPTGSFWRLPFPSQSPAARLLYVRLWLATGQLNEHESHNVDKNRARG